METSPSQSELFDNDPELLGIAEHLQEAIDTGTHVLPFVVVAVERYLHRSGAEYEDFI